MLRLGFPMAIFWLVVDQASKWSIVNYVMDPPQIVPVTSFFYIVLGRNTGVSFGLFGAAPPWLLVTFTAAVVAALSVWMSRAETRFTAIGLGLIVGGAFGNLADRLRHGGVTDFLDFYVGRWHWPAFNLADVGIVCGVGLLLLESFVLGNRSEPLGRDESRTGSPA